MKRIEHPSAFLAHELTDAIRQTGAAAEMLGSLHPAQLQIIRQQNWLNQFVPKEFGGLASSLSNGVRVEECLGWADGSTGWMVTLCSGAAWFSGFLSRGLLAEIFAGEHVCFAGSGAPTGIAQITERGYEVSGSWKYASGSLHATVFTANCIIQKDKDALLNEDGSPVVRAFLFKKEEVTIRADWNSMGMIATGSHGFEVRAVQVNASRCFAIDAKAAVSKHPLYQFPFLSFAEVTLCANLSGMAVRFLDLCKFLFDERIKSKSLADALATTLRQKLTDAEIEIESCRQEFYDSLDGSWAICENGQTLSSSQLGELSRRSRRLADVARKWVDGLYPYCGLSAANRETEINLVWRNFHTAGQHALFTFY